MDAPSHDLFRVYPEPLAIGRVGEAITSLTVDVSNQDRQIVSDGAQIYARGSQLSLGALQLLMRPAQTFRGLTWAPRCNAASRASRAAFSCCSAWVS